jgi:hypothetical protein
MASPGPYQPVTFEANSAQRAKRRVLGFVFLVIGAGLMAFSGKAGTGRGTAGLIIAGLCFAVLGALALANRRAYTMIDAEGIYASGLWGRRSCRWIDVTDVELKIGANDGPPMVYNIKIHRRGGRSFTLPAPTDSATKDRHDNPEFNQQLAVINSYWLNGAGPQHPGQARRLRGWLHERSRRVPLTRVASAR